MMACKGAFVISLDFELYWGMRDRVKLNDYRSNLLGARRAIPLLLQLFEKYGIHATWAVVGLLFYSNKEDLYQGLPSIKPDYQDSGLSPYHSIQTIGSNEKDDPYHYGHSLIKQILLTTGQEIGTHTFSHYYCLEEGQCADSFRDDLQSVHKAAQQFPGMKIRSLVFPQNQINLSYLPICQEAGIQAYRGNESSWFYQPRNHCKYNTHIRKALRFLDSYINLSGHNATNCKPTPGEVPVNIPSSKFLRPYSCSLKPLEPLKIRRIKKGLTHAAKHGLVYHLWWHPHNFGSHTEQNLQSLRKILDHFKNLQSTYGMESVSMGELSERLMRMEREINDVKENTYCPAGVSIDDSPISVCRSQQN